MCGLVALLAGCGGTPAPTPSQPTSPTAPAAPSVTVTGVRVGAAGNASTSIAPGDTLQLFALADSSDGTASDVTNLATWQSSNPAVATVSPSGLLTAAAEGALDVTAAYSGKSGSVHADIQRAGCKVTLSPDALVFGALSSSGQVTVTATLSTCRWTARSDASWLPVQFDPGRSGSGSFTYSVPGNNNTDARDARIVVTVVGGPTAVHNVHQERPVGCVYQVSPARLTFSTAGGPGAFQVTTIPSDCQWQIGEGWSDLRLDKTSGTGAATVSYTVLPNAGRFDHTLSVRGLSGLNPPGVHTVTVQ